MGFRTSGRQVAPLLVVLTIVLIVASGAAIADGDHSHGTTTTTAGTETTSAHSDSSTHTHDINNHTETETNDGHSGDGHHNSTDAAGDGHSGGGDGHHSGENSDNHHAGGDGGDHHNETPLGWATSIAGLFALVALPAAPVYWFGKQHGRFSGLSTIHIAAIGLILLSAAVHVHLYLQHGEIQMLLAGLGFVGAVVLFFLGVSRRLLYIVGIPYIGTQIGIWWLQGMPHLQSYGLLDKAVQLLLIGILGSLLWSEEILER